jgi:hypothetical protein
LLLTAGGCEFGLEYDVLEEVLQIGRVLPVPGAAPWLAGLAVWRGRIVTLVDAGQLFGTRPAEGQWMLILKGLPVAAGLKIDGFPRLVGAEEPPVSFLDLEVLSRHPAFQPGAAWPERTPGPETAPVPVPQTVHETVPIPEDL